ncbi:hypothetical protein C807_02220 [Lachnospiraceae bacterium 28-4]|nr:hypothetical protein C807_02220 [Lachnospiraceae bacterium 28-4]
MREGDNSDYIKKIDIFGSCVTRDIFNYGMNSSVKVGEYIARQSITTIFASPVTYEEREIDRLNSSFQKRMLKNDLEKTTFEKLKTSKGDFIVIDFIDERFHTIKFRNTYLTYSAELMMSEYLTGKKYSVLDKRKWFNKNVVFQLRHKVAMFAEELEKIYGADSIIIHRATIKDEYLDKQGNLQKFSKPYLEDNKKTNELLNDMYDELEKKLINPHVINVADLYYADEKNKWGLATMHYQEEYYLDVAKRVGEIVDSSLL